MLIFPKGVRLARDYEISDDANKTELLKKIREAQIEQGFVITDADDSRFNYYAEANVNAPQIWRLFRSLCETLLPAEVTPIVGETDEENLHHGKYESRRKLLDLFESFEFYLANDGYIQFGLAAESETELTEIFVAPTKHFQIWANDKDVIVKVMNQYGIAECEKLQFIDEFPRTTKSLKYENDFYSHDDLIEHLIEVTGEL